jgi:hypothetical protein
MSTYSNGFSVPTLSFTGSRANKQYNGLVPTRDYSHILSNNPPLIKMMRTSRTEFSRPSQAIPTPSWKSIVDHLSSLPKGSAPKKATVRNKVIVNIPRKDLNKNVYLERRDEYNGVEYERNTAWRF